MKIWHNISSVLLITIKYFQLEKLIFTKAFGNKGLKNICALLS